MEDKIQWHPAFCGAAELEFRDNKEDLVFEWEYNLSKEPIRIDLLIIKKITNSVIENQIGKIFKQYNVVEYKSPEDGLTIDDYFKTIGYACLYKGLGDTVNQIPADQLTITLVRDSYPTKMINELQKMGLWITQAYPGILYVTGNVQFKTQIIVTSQLDSELHMSFKVLTRKLTRSDADRFVTWVKEFVEPGDKSNADAVFEVSASANRALYEEMRRDPYMCNALREIMREEIEEEKEIGKEIGDAKRLIKNVASLQKKLDVSLEEACNLLDVTLDQYQAASELLK